MNTLLLVFVALILVCLWFRITPVDLLMWIVDIFSGSSNSDRGDGE